MYRVLAILACFCLTTTTFAQDIEAGDLETELFEWSSCHFPASCTDTFELGGEWIEFSAEDGTTRYAATGEGDHWLDVFQTEGTETLEVSVDTEVYWSIDEDGDPIALTVEFGTAIVEYTPPVEPWTADPVTDVTSWYASACSKRVGVTKDWKCESASKKCVVKVKTGSSGSQTRRGKCDGVHTITYDLLLRKLTFQN